jgi:spermidine/putrescine transport system ATP-binding protein
MEQPIVELHNVVKRRGSAVTLNGLSLSIRPGEFFSLLGPSGSGKTTILRLLAGFEQPDEGDIRIEGRSVSQVPPHRRPVNLVFQQYALFPHLTAAANIAFGLEMRRMARPEIAERVAQALAMVRLTAERDRFPHQLSGGEQQRVALARALVNRPAVVLLDEPLGALDQSLRRSMQVELKTIHEAVKSTFLYVTHHQEEALTMSDRVGVLREGRLLQVGSPRELYERPASWFVASFVGLSNCLECRVEQVNDGDCLLRPLPLSIEQPLVARIPFPVKPDDRVKLVVRPEKLNVCDRRSDRRHVNELPARVSKVLYHGSDEQVLVELPDGAQWTVRVTNGGGLPLSFRPGEPVAVRWSRDDAMVLTE